MGLTLKSLDNESPVFHQSICGSEEYSLLGFTATQRGSRDISEVFIFLSNFATLDFGH